MPFSIGAMPMFALIVWQALGFPEVEDPIPDRVGFGTIVGLAGAGGILMGVLGGMVQPRKRERYASIGTFVGLCLGVVLYGLSLFAQLISSL